MSIGKYCFLLVMLAVTPFVYASKTFCEKQIEKYQKCEASFHFQEMYQSLCEDAPNLNSSDINSMHRALEAELDTNPCLQRVYKPPRVDRKAYRERYKENREFLEEQRKKR